MTGPPPPAAGAPRGYSLRGSAGDLNMCSTSTTVAVPIPSLGVHRRASGSGSRVGARLPRHRLEPQHRGRRGLAKAHSGLDRCRDAPRLRADRAFALSARCRRQRHRLLCCVPGTRGDRRLRILGRLWDTRLVEQVGFAQSLAPLNVIGDCAEKLLATAARFRLRGLFSGPARSRRRGGARRRRHGVSPSISVCGDDGRARHRRGGSSGGALGVVPPWRKCFRSNLRLFLVEQRS